MYLLKSHLTQKGTNRLKEDDPPVTVTYEGAVVKGTWTDEWTLKNGSVIAFLDNAVIINFN